jgi:hypothetical protein
MWQSEFSPDYTSKKQQNLKDNYTDGFYGKFSIIWATTRRERKLYIGRMITCSIFN